MKDLLPAILPTLTQFLLPLVLAGVSWLIVKATSWFQAQTKNAYLGGVIGRLGVFVDTTVRALEQTIVQELKDANADGVLSAAEAAKIKADALGQLKSLLGAKGLKELVSVLGIDPSGIDRFLSDHIEAAVQRVSTPAPAPAGQGAPANP